MTIPNLNSPTNNINPVPCLDLVPANQLAVEPICSWRLSDPQLELQVFRDNDNIRYSVYNHYSSANCYWLKSAYSPVDLISVFTHCVWKNTKGLIQSRLFSDGSMAVLVSVIPRKKIIAVKEWTENFNDFLITHNPIISAVNDDNSLEFQEQIRETSLPLPYEPTAEEGMLRYLKTQEGELVIFQEKPVREKTVKVWPGDRDIRLIKLHKSQGEIICRVFDWKNQENSEICSRFAPSAEPRLPCAEHRLPNIDDVIEYTQRCVPQLETVNNQEVVTFYKEHPLMCFMPDYYDLFRTDG